MKIRNEEFPVKRFIVSHDGIFVVGIYAERYVKRTGANSFTGATGGDFFVGDKIVASIDNDARFPVGDSGRILVQNSAYEVFGPPW